MSRIDKFISDNLKKVGKSYKFDANTLDVIEETDAKLEGGLLAQLKTRTFNYRNNTVVNRTEDVTLKGIHLQKKL